MKRPYGMAEDAFPAYIQAFFDAGINPEKTKQGAPRIAQTIGHAEASAGTHAQDGNDQFGHDYTCALDISVRHDLTQAQIEKLLQCLWSEGFCAWWRHTGSFADNPHVHAIWAGDRMKRILRDQVHDFLKCKSGLVGHADDQFIVQHLTEEQEQHIRALFLARNPANR